MSVENNKSATTTGVPQWIEAKLFERLLEDLEAEYKEIQDFKVDYALAPGENYATIMLKVEIVMRLKDNSSKPITFMLKVGHDNDVFRELMQSHDMFEVESGMYRTIVPELEQVYLEAGLKVNFGSKAYTLPTTQPYILLENLKTRGFRNVNRLEGLDMIHAQSVLKKLAQWHAASAFRVATKGPYPEMYSKGFVKTDCYELIKTMFEGSTITLLECVKEYSNSAIYYDKVAKLQSRITDALYKLLDIDDGDDDDFKVLNHGDCWSNNIMFRYDEKSGELLETYLVDYQIPRYYSPAQDLLYFILSSCKYEIKLQEFDYMINYYHKHLVENLRLLKYAKKIPTLKDIHCALFKYGEWGYSTVSNVMAAVLCDPCDNASLDNFMTDSEDGIAFKKLMYSNPRYRKHMEAILPWLLNRGLLDF